MELTFQKGIVIFFGILLVIILIFLGVMMNKKNTTAPWPPTMSPCPDYWIDGPHSMVSTTPYISGSSCKASKTNLNNPYKQKEMNFTTSEYTGTSGACNKYTWATTNNPCN